MHAFLSNETAPLHARERLCKPWLNAQIIPKVLSSKPRNSQHGASHPVAMPTREEAGTTPTPAFLVTQGLELSAWRWGELQTPEDPNCRPSTWMLQGSRSSKVAVRFGFLSMQALRRQTHRKVGCAVRRLYSSQVRLLLTPKLTTRLKASSLGSTSPEPQKNSELPKSPALAEELKRAKCSKLWRCTTSGPLASLLSSRTSVRTEIIWGVFVFRSLE